MKKISFRLFAYTDAAGKYDPAAPLLGNEDNFYVDDDLTDEIPGNCKPDQVIEMTDCGVLMCVADGMGGMNAGEVASAIAVQTVQDWFSPGKITPSLAKSAKDRRAYLENLIKDADRRIKQDAKTNPQHEGMGSTIILAWIVGDELTLSWCGDSRAYRFNPANGIEPLSRDHSYVQELVNQGTISYEDTFEHPQGNIVTRSLGDPSSAAKPESREFKVYNGDIILLCSDGLSGVLRDKKTLDHNGNLYPGDNIEDIMAANTASMRACKDALIAAAEKADWYDNVTVLLCQIVEGGAAPEKRESKPAVSAPLKINGNQSSKEPIEPGTKKNGKWLWIALIIIVVMLLCGLFYYIGFNKAGNASEKEGINPLDTIDIFNGEEAEGQEIQPVDSPEAPGATNAPGSNGKETTTPKATTPSQQQPAENSGGESTAPKGATQQPTGSADFEAYKNQLLQVLAQTNCPELNWLKEKAENSINGMREGNRQDAQYCVSLINQFQTRATLINELKAMNRPDLTQGLIEKISDSSNEFLSRQAISSYRLEINTLKQQLSQPTPVQSQEELTIPS